jgi:hypothetical protein
MSATGRGAERITADFYPTPAWCVRRLLDTEPFGSTPAAVWHEPCAGDGAIIRAVNGYRVSAPKWNATELREDAVRLLANASDLGGISVRGPCDYLIAPPWGSDIVITNPPFALSFPVAQKALRECHGHVALLLRLNWLGSGTESGRSEWLRKNPPDVYVLPNRPSFAASLKCTAVGTGCGWKEMLPISAPRPAKCPKCGGHRSCSTTDATEYAWFVWTPDRERKKGSVQVLNETPESERSAA